ncbi:MAG: DUF3179 domain-containing protein [Anaerolineae bacterium]|nr:DUF3179 domain-containing protein [Anaerolineae bacterium]MBL6966177.1 DUF3179 domain-containing protein [Anaerolineales bacterium]
MPRISIVFSLLLAGAALAACSPALAQAEIPQDSIEAISPTATPLSNSTQNTHACDDPFDGATPAFNTTYWSTDFCQHSIDYSEIFSGGPPPDGIPPIDAPRFEEITSADSWLENREPVIGLVLNGEARAYPLQILTWHEIVNDEVAGLPVTVTFCPLCNTALVFERPEMDGEILTFGTSGNLRNSDLVMYDRQTQSWWQQFSGEAIVGELTGSRLTPIPASIIAWEDFKAAYPQGQVLSQDTGFSRSYGQNPYVGYDNVSAYPFLFTGEVDDQLRPMDRVVGIWLESGEAVAYPYLRIREELVINDTLSELPLVVFWKAGAASALDTATIAEGNDIGSTGVFSAELEGELLTFSANEDGTFTDNNTNSTWDIFGQAIDGPLTGKSLHAISHHDTFWFAWAAFVPGETLRSLEN